MEENNDKNKIEMEKLCTAIEAVLFWKGEPISIKKLSQIFSTYSGSTEGRQKVVTEEKILTALNKLEESLNGRGVSLIRKEDEVALGTSKDTSVEQVLKLFR
ncbi:MAG: SMC-Scp complex subunit ScpB [Candidatus Taylorbacteria bacterium]|nr:SMC-Scp complex subunit ScpB [Candidatus Taylorbacteria bacterium]